MIRFSHFTAHALSLLGLCTGRWEYGVKILTEVLAASPLETASTQSQGSSAPWTGPWKLSLYQSWRRHTLLTPEYCGRDMTPMNRDVWRNIQPMILRLWLTCSSAWWTRPPRRERRWRRWCRWWTEARRSRRRTPPARNSSASPSRKRSSASPALAATRRRHFCRSGPLGNKQPAGG